MTNLWKTSVFMAEFKPLNIFTANFACHRDFIFSFVWAAHLFGSLSPLKNDKTHLPHKEIQIFTKLVWWIFLGWHSEDASVPMRLIFAWCTIQGEGPMIGGSMYNLGSRLSQHHFHPKWEVLLTMTDFCTITALWGSHKVINNARWLYQLGGSNYNEQVCHVATVNVLTWFPPLNQDLP